jgi:hypothetical protein
MQVQIFGVGTTAAESECSYDRAVVKVKDWRTAGPLEGTSSYACTSTSAGLVSKCALMLLFGGELVRSATQKRPGQRKPVGEEEARLAGRHLTHMGNRGVRSSDL